MSGTVIDALYVTLGLNSEGFNAGLKAATASLTGFATKIAGLAIGFEGLEAGIRYFTQLHEKMADLEFTARNLGIMGTELSKLGEMAKMFGGSFDDAKSSVEGLQAAVYNLRFHGQMSEQLIALQRWGVRYLDPMGHVRNEVDIARDVASRIDWQSQRTPGGLEPGQRRQMALDLLGSGSGGLASAAAAGAANFDEVWRKVQEDQKGLSGKMLRDNAKAYQDLDVSSRAQRDIRNMPILDTFLPALESMNADLQDLASKAIPYLTQGIAKLREAILHPPKELQDLVKSAKEIAEGTKKFWDSTMLPPTRPGEKPVSALALGAGGNRLGEILRDRFDQWMSKFTGLPLSTVPVVPPSIPTPTAPRPSSPSGPPSGKNGTPTTSITFENVVVHPRGEDAKAFADDFVAQARRKLLSVSSERGLV